MIERHLAEADAGAEAGAGASGHTESHRFGMFLTQVALAFLTVAAVACGDSDGEVVGGAADGGSTLDAAGVGDSDTVAAIDVAPEASATTKTDAADPTADAEDVVADALADASPADTAPAPDAGPPDAGPPDTGTPDTGAPDTKPDTAKPDAAGDPCPAKVAAYLATRQAALSCNTFWECTVEAPDGPACPCQVHYSSANLKGQSVVDAEADFKKSGCKAGTCSAPCLDPVKSVGLCQASGVGASACKTTVPTCKELDALATKTLQEGANCTADADCGFKVSNTLGCGCPTFVNLKTMGPGKPLFVFMIQLVQSYKAQACTSDVACSCPNPNSATCVAGKCMPKG